MKDPEPGDGFPKEWLYGETLGRMDVARIFNVDPTTVSRWARDGVLGSFRKPGGTRVFPECEVHRLMRGEPASEFVKRNAERDTKLYHDRWAAGYRNSGVSAFVRKEDRGDGDE